MKFPIDQPRRGCTECGDQSVPSGSTCPQCRFYLEHRRHFLATSKFVGGRLRLVTKGRRL